MAIDERFRLKESEEKTRRAFLQQAGIAAGGLGLFGLSGQSVWAQTQKCQASQSVTPTNCTPPQSPTPPIPFKPDTSPAVRKRKSAFELNATDIAKLQAAYCALRNLTVSDPNDPRGWLQQAAVHCHYCSGPQSDELPEIHGSWWFMPWHRCYLYFHERILGKLINDPTFTLPYWDWDQPARNVLPPPYVTPNNQTNTLFDFNRGVTPTDSIPAKYVGHDYIYGGGNQPGIMNAPTNLKFMGGPNPDPENKNIGGVMENGPHGLVHLWVGKPSLAPAGGPDMGVLATAAQDPIFFAHHSNIDRLWDVWLHNAKPPYQHVNFSQSSWLNNSWTFYDENKQWVSIKVSDVLDMENSLRYTYQPPSTAQPLAMNARESITVAAAAQNVTAKVDAVPAGKNALTPNPLTRRIKLPDELHSRILAARPSPEKRPPEYTLHIDGIETPPDKSAIVHVFVNLPRANAATKTDSINFAGYFTVVAKGRSRHHDGHNPTNVAFDLSPNLAALVKNGKELTVTLVPVNGRNNKPANITLSFQKIYVTETTY